ncbi:hypothetical protein EV700_1470 [Fluviicoccus keumensis]|uniref:Chlorophyllase-like protein n=1 Tax=Fluviicoccus keumensis TaxID=1435465 RepID=A0A4Q7ZB86_9GAMM|nr:alpha/beta hydrolase [Fluviicoccus keumensis]RZU47079.1 hypothetical protein EV700_1470 [Fluviicoccus keumensis]
MKHAWLALMLTLNPLTSALADTVVYDAADGKVINAKLSIGGTAYSVDWYLPSSTPTALMTYQHGFSRGCGNHRNTSLNIMRKNVMVLCVNASMSGGNPALAKSFAQLLASRNVLAPGNIPLPAPIIVGGHSAGGHFATELGKQLVAYGYPYLKGAVLFDPVAQSGFTDNLMAISMNGSRPVLAVTANSNICNMYNNAYGALRQIQQFAASAGKSSFTGVQLTSSSTHVDSEGDNTDFLGYSACLSLAPKAANTGYLRTLSAAWVADIANGTHDDAYYPGGYYLSNLIGNSKAKLIQ